MKPKNSIQGVGLSDHAKKTTHSSPEAKEARHCLSPSSLGSRFTEAWQEDPQALPIKNSHAVNEHDCNQDRSSEPA